MPVITERELEMSASGGLLPGASLHPDFSPSSFSHSIYFAAVKASPGSSSNGQEGKKLPESVTKDTLKPVVLEWLKNDAERYGFFSRMPSFIRNFIIPAGEARWRLIEKDDWASVLSLLYMDREITFSNMQAELLKLPESYTASPQYQQELKVNSSPKFVRFYNALWNLMTAVMTDAEVQFVLSQFKSSRRPSYADTAYLLLQYAPIAKHITVSEDSHEQLALVKELGPQIYKNWKLEA